MIATTPLPIEWRAVVGYERHYEVSNAGHVRRIAPASKPGGYSHVGRLLLPDVQHTGYLQVTLYCNGVARRFKVHRLVCIAFHGAPPEWATEINHKNGVRHDNHACNLEWSNRTHNARHATETLGMSCGAKNPRAKLTLSDVVAIRERVAGGERPSAVARAYGISKTHVGYIRDGKSWNR